MKIGEKVQADILMAMKAGDEHRLPHHHGSFMLRPDYSLRISTSRSARSRLFIIAPVGSVAVAGHEPLD